MQEETVFLIQIDLDDKTPVSEQIQDAIRKQIDLGQLQVGSQLPTVRQLAAHLDVNFNTVARAYRALDLEGRVITRQGRGTFIARPRHNATPPEDATEQASKGELLRRLFERFVREAIAAGFSQSEIEQTISSLMPEPTRFQREIEPQKELGRLRKIWKHSRLKAIKPLLTRGVYAKQKMQVSSVAAVKTTRRTTKRSAKKR